MNTRLLLIALAVIVGGRCANAGVIVGQSHAIIECSETDSASVLCERLIANDQEDESQTDVQRHSGNFANDGFERVNAPTVQAFLNSEASLLAQPTPHARIVLSNSILPSCPIMDGLLKPS